MRTQALPFQLVLLLAALFPVATLARSWRADRCPDAIKTLVPSYSGPGRDQKSTFGTMVSVHDALCSCPNITSLDLRVTGLGCTEFPDRWNFPFRLDGGDKYPPLKHLRLEGYNFQDKAWDEVQYEEYSRVFPWYERIMDWVYSGNAWKYFKYQKLEPSQRSKTNLELWLDAMDWSQIESLGLLDNDAPLEIIPRLTSLRQLELSSYNETVWLQFITGLKKNSLTHLTLTGRPLPSLPLILDHHGESLEHLELRAPEIMSSSSPTYNTTEFELLANMAPNLSYLSVNMPRQEPQMLQALDHISSIGSIRNLELWFDITAECRRQLPERMSYSRSRYDEVYQEFVAMNGECKGETEYARPYVDQEFALDMFKRIRLSTNGRNFDNVTFWVGDWSRPWDGALYFPDWLEDKRSKAVCSLEGKLEGEDWCVVERGKEYWKRDEYWREYYDYDDYGDDDE